MFISKSLYTPGVNILTGTRAIWYILPLTLPSVLISTSLHANVQYNLVPFLDCIAAVVEVGCCESPGGITWQVKFMQCMQFVFEIEDSLKAV